LNVTLTTVHHLYIVVQACVDESYAYGALSREDLLSKWLEHCANSHFVFDDHQSPTRADSMLEVCQWVYLNLFYI